MDEGAAIDADHCREARLLQFRKEGDEGARHDASRGCSLMGILFLARPVGFSMRIASGARPFYRRRHEQFCNC